MRSTQRKQVTRGIPAAAALLCCWGPLALAQSPAADGAATTGLRLTQALEQGRLVLEVRPRYNHIRETAKPDATDVWTVRAIAGWQSGPIGDFRFMAQVIGTDYLGPKRFNDDPARGGSSRYPLLPDPRSNGLNQLYVDYTGMADTRLRVGWQVVRMGNERFLSDNDFRQTPTIFDGVTVRNTSLPDTEIVAGDYWRQRTALGRQAPATLRALSIAHNPLPGHSVSVYGYWHDQAATGAQTGFASNANRVLGIAAEGGIALSLSTTLHYRAEAARQSNLSGGDSRIDAGYHRLGVAVAGSAWSLGVDDERKGSNRGQYGFQTPLSNFYGFNGTALQFTTTPAQGLRDRWLTATLAWNRWHLSTEWHTFRTDFAGAAASRELGREWDFLATYALRPDLDLRVQHARFRAGSAARAPNDVDKTWVSVTYRY